MAKEAPVQIESGELDSVNVGAVVPVRGVLVFDNAFGRPCRLFLDIDGVGRLVLNQEGNQFVGSAFLRCVTLGTNSESATRKDSNSEWFDRIMSTHGAWNLFSPGLRERIISED